jgi:hypothetical protein
MTQYNLKRGLRKFGDKGAKAAMDKLTQLHIMDTWTAIDLELYPDSVFRYGIGWYFLGIFLTNTEGKLGKGLRYRTFGRNPFFPCFCPLFDGPSPPFEGSSRKISQNGAPAKSYSTKNIVHTIPNIPTGKCR